MLVRDWWSRQVKGWICVRPSASRGSDTVKQADAWVVGMVAIFVAPMARGQLPTKPEHVNWPKVTSAFQAEDITIGKWANLMDDLKAAGSVAGQAAKTVHPGQRLSLAEGWQLKSSMLVQEDGERISTGGYKPQEWLETAVPSTVLSALVKNGVYPDPRVALNAYQIPDSSDEFNQKHDLSRFSYLPDKRNPWRDPYWYRTEFKLPSLPPDKRVWLHFDAINYRAEVWVNGTQIADREKMAGMFQRFQFDITEHARVGVNMLAVKIYPVDHPGTPDTQLEVLGRDRGYVGKEIMRDVTEIMTIGYDCMMTVPDRNMGLWQNVWIEFTGPVDIRHPFVATDLPLPETNRATLTVSAELTNGTAAPVKGVLRGAIAGTDLRFAQPVELGPNETKTVTIEPKLVMTNPRLWWPAHYGEQYLYDLVLQFETNGAVSSDRKVTFGVREVGHEMHEVNGWHGRRVLVNGQKILCRGGYIQPELMFDWDARRMETEIRYYAQANLNLIYFEDIPNPPEPFLALCDRYGILFGNCFYSCYWLRPGTPYPDDFALLERCTVDVVKRYRNHPSLIMYMAMNEGDTTQEIYEMWRRHILTLDGTRWFIPSASFPSDRKQVPDWFKKDLPTGMTDIGASYSWAEPVQYFRWVREARNWMFMMESGSASLPPISSLSKFIANANARSSGEKLFPLDAAWAHHGANHYYKGYDQALRGLHGEPESVADYCWKGHLVTADQHRSMFEAVNHRMWDISSGFTQWKINSCEPSVQWQIFDWYLKPMVSWFYIKKACEPLHVQLNPPGPAFGGVSVINTRLAPKPGLEVTARVFDLDAKLRWEKAAKLDAPANAYREVFLLENVPGSSPVAFVKLELKDRHGQLVSDNFYWLAERSADGLKTLQKLPPVKLNTSYNVEACGGDRIVRARLNNPTDQLAFFIQLAVTKGPRGEEVLPVFWSDNYFSLLPHESREVTATFAATDLAGAEPVLEVGGWNIQTDYDCRNLTISSAEAKADEPVMVSATIANTFLDGSRVTLLVDDHPVDSKWAWARDGNSDEVSFEVRLSQPGMHRLAVSNRNLEVKVE